MSVSEGVNFESGPQKRVVFTENVVPPSDAGRALIIVDAVLIVLTTTWMAMRVYSRHVRQIALAVEDYVHVFALVLLAFSDWTAQYQC